MLAGIVDRAYRTPTVPREREYKGLIVYVCVLQPRPCYTACSIVWLFAVFLPACEHTALSLRHCVTMLELQLRYFTDVMSPLTNKPSNASTLGPYHSPGQKEKIVIFRKAADVV